MDMRAEPLLEPEKRCAECGRFGAVVMGDVALCPDCLAAKGSCCGNEESPPASDDDSPELQSRFGVEG